MAGFGMQARHAPTFATVKPAVDRQLAHPCCQADI